MEEEASRRILETESFKRSSTVRFVGLSTTSSNANQKSMRYQEEDTITTITKEGTTKVITRVKMITMGRRIGTRTPKVLTRRKRIRKNPRTRMCT